MEKSNDVPTLEIQREKVLQLSALQKELREAVAIKMERENVNLACLSNHVKTGWNELRDFLKCERAICVERVVKNLCNYVKLGHLANKIIDAANGLPMKIQGISVLSEKVINLIYELHMEFQKHSKVLTIKTFASIFTPYNSVAVDLLQFNRKNLLNLDKIAAAKINEILHNDNLTKMCQKAQNSEIESKAVKAHKLGDLVTQLLPYFNNTEDLAEKLGFSKSALKAALDGDVTVGDETFKTMIKEAEKLLKINATEPIEKVPKVHIAFDNTLINGFGSISKLGVKYVLGPNDFKAIELQTSQDEVQIIGLTERALERARALLNICTQIKDPKIKGKISNVLGPQLEEMVLAIRLVTSENPNGLTGIFQGQRETWYSDGDRRFQPKRKEGTQK